MLTGWGIFAVVFAFSVGVIVGAALLAVTAMHTALKKIGSATGSSPDLNARIEEAKARLMDRAEQIKRARETVDRIAKTAPSPMPRMRSILCTECGETWSGRPNVAPVCCACKSTDCVDVSMMGDRPFIGVPS